MQQERGKQKHSHVLVNFDNEITPNLYQEKAWENESPIAKKHKGKPT